MKMIAALLLLCCFGNAMGRAEVQRQEEGKSNRKLIIVTLDGFRWQELFHGGDPYLLSHAARQDPHLSTLFYHPEPSVRRKLLLPFLWQVVAKKGLVLGNRDKGNRVDVANPYALSYAGYNELFTGSADLRLWSNEAVDNPNRNIFEYLNELRAFRGKVASFGSWGLFTHIFNHRRSRFFLNSGIPGHPRGKKAVRKDLATFLAAGKYLRKHQPRILHIGFGGTDEAGHTNDYGLYLRQARLADSLVGQLWREVQAMAFYRGQTTLILTTDHGRGHSRRNWGRHGIFVPGSAQTWIAMVGDGIPALGEQLGDAQYHSAQVAGTIGFLLRAPHFAKRTLPIKFLTANSSGSVGSR